MPVRNPQASNIISRSDIIGGLAGLAGVGVMMGGGSLVGEVTYRLVPAFSKITDQPFAFVEVMSWILMTLAFGFGFSATLWVLSRLKLMRPAGWVVKWALIEAAAFWLLIILINKVQFEFLSYAGAAPIWFDILAATAFAAAYATGAVLVYRRQIHADRKGSSTKRAKPAKL